MVPILAFILVLGLLGALAFSLFGGDPPDGRAAVSPTPSVSRSPSASPSSTPSASPDSVDAAVETLETVVADGVAAGRISSKAEEEILHGLDEAVRKFSEGDTEKALEELDHLREKVDDLIEHDEIANSEKQKLLRAIDDVAEQMIIAADEEGD